MISYSRAEYLDLIGDWQDPNPKPILEEYEGFMVVRDDLLYGGTKSRVADYLISSDLEVEVQQMDMHRYHLPYCVSNGIRS